MSKLTKQIENIFEVFLWKARLITLLAVLFSLISSLALFVAGSIKVVAMVQVMFTPDFQHLQYNLLLSNIIAAIDLYLIAVVLLIFSFGLYELFISKIDPARNE
jgi:uncharacterized membrane protein YqhA